MELGSLKGEQPGSLEITDGSGRRDKREPIKGMITEGRISFPVLDYANGIYIITIIIDKSTHSRSFSVVK